MRRLVIGLLLQRYREADLAADAAAAAIAAAGAGVVAARMAEEECLRALALRRLWFLEGLRTAAAVGRRAAMAAAAAVRSARRGVQYSVVVAEVMRGQQRLQERVRGRRAGGSRGRRTRQRIFQGAHRRMQVPACSHRQRLGRNGPRCTGHQRHGQRKRWQHWEVGFHMAGDQPRAGQVTRLLGACRGIPQLRRDWRPVECSTEVENLSKRQK